MKSFPPTLSRYLAGRYLMTFVYLLAALLALIYLLDLVELLRRAGKQENVPLGVVLEMGLFKLPEVGQVVLPFAILFSSMFTFWALTKRYELAVIRAAGLSVWQFLLPIVAVGFLCGVLHVTAINPLSAFMIGKFEQYETRYLGRQKNLVSVFKDGFWIRERETRAGEVILNAEKINPETWEFQNVMGLAFDESGTLSGRMDAASARLEPGYWVFSHAHIAQPGRENKTFDTYKLPTDLTHKDIEESFANPETISFWKIPAYIKTLEATGFDSTSLKIHFHYLLSLPLFFTSMILLAASLSFRSPRSGYTLVMTVTGIALGILVFFLSSYLRALGASGQLSPELAAWTPALITTLFGLTALLTLEDG
ncbi:MAG: LPS export ABC transporter permease LptG [Rhodospirillales bacterium]|nr:LPS export ABC transporter permease LptG [Rhodospirillales bacterium]